MDPLSSVVISHFQHPQILIVHIIPVHFMPVVIEIVIESVLILILYLCERKFKVFLVLQLVRLVFQIIVHEFIEFVLKIITLYFYYECQWSYIKHIANF